MNGQTKNRLETTSPTKHIMVGVSTIANKLRPMGETGIWLVVFGDLVLFGLFFGMCAHGYYLDPSRFRADQSLLDRDIGLVNTLLLLTSSLFVALAVDAARNQGQRIAGYFCTGVACGLGFVAIKSVEWAVKFQAGIGVSSSDFFMYFFTLCGIHLAHVVVGLIVLTIMWRHCQRQPLDRNVPMLESGAIFWHLVDVLWVMLFALLYLVRK
jgi:nitric oxide reductase NorE protein